MTLPTFENLVNAVTRWAEEQEANIVKHGRPLSPAEHALAARVGVREPHRIRVLLVPEVPFPNDTTVLTVASLVGLHSELTAGMTLRYGIYLRSDSIQQRGIWPHEFRHVAQYENFGSIRGFMEAYLRELINCRYGHGPLETDARAAEAHALPEGSDL